MKRGPVTKLDTRNKTTFKKLTVTSCHQIVFLFIDGQLGVIRKPDSGWIVCKIYIFINSNL